MPKVPDSQFKNSLDLDKMSCIGSDRLLIKTPDTVAITDVCQDPFNPALVEIKIVVTGVLQFTPTCKILKVDDDTTYLSRSVFAPLFERHANSSSMPIDTNCDTVSAFTVVFDFGAVITEFLGASIVEFELFLDGKLAKSLSVPGFKKIENKISTKKLWTKGPTPNPIGVQYDSTKKKLVAFFQLGENIPCSCKIQCRTLKREINDVQYCDDTTSRVIIDYDISGDPLSVLLKFSDSFGNFKILTIQPMTDVVPATPTTVPEVNPNRISLAIYKRSIGNTELTGNIAYQIWRYIDNDSTAHIWKDWNYRDYSSFTDDKVIPGRTYGYAVRFKGEYKDESRISAWTTARV